MLRPTDRRLEIDDEYVQFPDGAYFFKLYCYSTGTVSDGKTHNCAKWSGPRQILSESVSIGIVRWFHLGPALTVSGLNCGTVCAPNVFTE
jgi:hypothetical protein